MNVSSLVLGECVISLNQYELLFTSVVHEKSLVHYPEKMHPYIVKNYELDQSLQIDFTLNKKLFNKLQKTEVHSVYLIAEAWCLDAAIILPLLRAIEVSNGKINIGIVRRDLNENVMNQFLTNGSKSIPIVFATNSDEGIVFRWGPRSSKAKDFFESIRDRELKDRIELLTAFYKEDRTQDIQEEWVELF